MDDLISRHQAINEANAWLLECLGVQKQDRSCGLIRRLEDLPSVQPDLNEWCHDCKEYDSEKHCCPRFNRVIRQAMKDAQLERKRGRWLELTNTNHTYVCSVCGRMLVNITDGKNTVTKNYPYCHCGADMRGNTDE